MSRNPTTITVPIAELAGSITTSARAVIVQRRLIVCDMDAIPLDQAALDRVLRELGRNAAGVIALLEVEADE